MGGIEEDCGRLRAELDRISFWAGRALALLHRINAAGDHGELGDAQCAVRDFLLELEPCKPNPSGEPVAGSITPSQNTTTR